MVVIHHDISKILKLNWRGMMNITKRLLLAFSLLIIREGANKFLI